MIELTYPEHLDRLTECAQRVRDTTPGTEKENTAITRLAIAIRDSIAAGVTQADRRVALQTAPIVRSGVLAGVQ